MVLAGTWPPTLDGRIGSGRDVRIQRGHGWWPTGAEGREGPRARLRACPFRSVPAMAVSGASPLEGVSRACAATNSCSSSVRTCRTTEPGPRRPDHPADRHRRRPDRQGRPVGPPPAGLPDRSPPRGLVPHHPVRGPVGSDRRARAHPAHHRGGAPPPRHPRRAPGQGRPRATVPRTTGSTRTDIPPGLDDEDDDETAEFIDESESEAAPAAID